MARTMEQPVYGGPERRTGVDRRSASLLRSDWRWIYRGRRHWGRRAGDQPTDWHSPRTFALVIGIFLLSAVDAGMTLSLLRTGHVVEANPIMRALIEHEVQVFINVKAVLTGWGLLVLVVCSRLTVLRRVPVRRLLVGIFSLYALLVGWEVYLVRATSGY